MYFPDVAVLVDLSKPHEWLDKEIEKIIAYSGSDRGKRADLLVRVFLKDGSKRILLLHIEIQSHKDKQLPNRVHLYWAGLFFQTEEKVVSLVVLADLNKDWHPTKDQFQMGNFKSEINFETCKLLDLLNKNPNAQGLAYEIARAQIASLKTRNNPTERYKIKKQQLLSLYKSGYTADDVRRAYGLIDHMMLLNETLRQQLNQDIEKYELETTMPFITSMEQSGIEKAKLEIAGRLIEAGMTDEKIVEITELPLETVQQLREK